MDENLVELESFKISTQALHSIVCLATEEVEGVELAKGFIGNISQRLGMGGGERPVKVQVKDSEVEVRLTLRVDYGLSLPQVAREVQFKIKAAMETMTGLRVRGVDVSVEGVNFPARE